MSIVWTEAPLQKNTGTPAETVQSNGVTTDVTTVSSWLTDTLSIVSPKGRKTACFSTGQTFKVDASVDWDYTSQIHARLYWPPGYTSASFDSVKDVDETHKKLQWQVIAPDTASFDPIRSLFPPGAWTPCSPAYPSEATPYAFRPHAIPSGSFSRPCHYRTQGGHERFQC